MTIIEAKTTKSVINSRENKKSNREGKVILVYDMAQLSIRFYNHKR